MPYADNDPIFRSLFALERARRIPLAALVCAFAFYSLFFWIPEIPAAAGALFALWVLLDSYLASGWNRAFDGAPSAGWERMQAEGRHAFLPALAGAFAVGLVAAIPAKLVVLAVLASFLALWLVAAAIRSKPAKIPVLAPPLKTYSALEQHGNRGFGYVLSTSIHILGCFLPVIAALLASWLGRNIPHPPKKIHNGDVIIVKLKIPPRPDQPKTLPSPPKGHSLAPPPPEQSRAPIDVNKLDTSAMQIQFADDSRRHALSPVIANYEALVAFIDPEDLRDYLGKKLPALPASYVFSATDWHQIAGPGSPVDVSGKFLIVLDDHPERNPDIARLIALVGADAAKLQVFLAFPRIADGFEDKLNSAIRDRAQKEIDSLRGSIISRVLLAFAQEVPAGISVEHIEAAKAPARGN